MEKLSDRWMYYSGLLAMHGVGVEDLKHIQNLIDAKEQGLLLKIGCHCKDCVHVDYAGCKGTTVYCMKHECYMQEDGFCNYAEAEAALEKIKGEEHE